MARREARKGDADTKVEFLAREHGLGEALVRVAEVGHGLLDVLGRDRRKVRAVDDRARPQRVFADVEDLEGDCLALAVAVKEEHEAVAVLGRLPQVAQDSAVRRNPHDRRLEELGRIAAVPVAVGWRKVEIEAVAQHGRHAVLAEAAAEAAAELVRARRSAARGHGALRERLGERIGNAGLLGDAHVGPEVLGHGRCAQRHDELSGAPTGATCIAGQRRTVKCVEDVDCGTRLPRALVLTPSRPDARARARQPPREARVGRSRESCGPTCGDAP